MSVGQPAPSLAARLRDAVRALLGRPRATRVTAAWPVPGAVRRARVRRLAAAVLVALAVPLTISMLSPHAASDDVTVDVARSDLVAGQPIGANAIEPRRLPAACVPPGAIRPGAAITGLVPAVPVRAGELLTGDRLLGASLLDDLARGTAPRSLVAVPVRFADAQATRLLRAGQRVDVFATTTGLGDGSAAGTYGGDSPATATAPEASAPGHRIGGRGGWRLFGGTARAVGGGHRPRNELADDVTVLTVPSDGGQAAQSAALSSATDPGGDDGGLVVLATDRATAARLTGVPDGTRLGFALLP
jgi:pilus assembly protein CpaB